MLERFWAAYITSWAGHPKNPHFGQRHLNENGVLAINLPFQANLHGARITRHAHPETLRRFEALLQALWPFDSRPTVHNPFFELTKAEEIRYLCKAAQLAEETVTCEYARRQVATLKNWLKRSHRQYAKARECGLCVPCLVRRSAMEIAGITESPGHYVFDARRAFHKPGAYRNAPLYGQVAGYVRDLYGFAQRTAKIRPCEFGLSYLYELSLLPGPTENFADSVRTTYQLYRRFARQFIKYLGT